VRHSEKGIEVLELPAPSGDGVLVKVRAAGICQTDLNLIKLGPLAFTLGHEFAGELSDGTPVGIQPTVPCGHCELCQRGEFVWCEEGYQRLIGIGQDGGMADELIVPESSLVALPRGLDASDAHLIEPLAVNLHSLDLARFDGRMRTLVVGANVTGFGLLAVAGAVHRGASVDLEADRDFQREAGARLGAGIEPKGTYDLVIEADGSEESIQRACERCRPGGVVLLVAGYYTPKTLQVTTAAVRELTMIWGTFYGHSATGRDVDAAAALLARNPEIARTLNTHRFPLDAAAEAFEFAASDSESLKVVLEP
jgi:2-desacetyl-2-hydroxyethyl bacteriochlorophyllide A dehydrogenase